MSEHTRVKIPRWSRHWRRPRPRSGRRHNFLCARARLGKQVVGAAHSSEWYDSPAIFLCGGNEIESVGGLLFFTHEMVSPDGSMLQRVLIPCCVQSNVDSTQHSAHATRGAWVNFTDPDDSRAPPQARRLNDEYVVGKKLGTGSYAVVREAMCKRNNGVFAVKIIDRKQAKEQRLKSEVSEQKPSQLPGNRVLPATRPSTSAPSQRHAPEICTTVASLRCRCPFLVRDNRGMG